MNLCKEYELAATLLSRQLAESNKLIERLLGLLAAEDEKDDSHFESVRGVTGR